MTASAASGRLARGSHAPAGGLAGLLLDAVERYPARPAVRNERRQITYSELGSLSMAVAGTFAAHGIGPGHRVCLWLNKSIEAIAGIYGTLLSGAAYVPVDPTAPPRRAAHILTDCHLACLLTTADRLSALSAVMPGQLDCRLVILVGETLGGETATGILDGRLGKSLLMSWQDAVAARRSPHRPAAPAADDLAYILYTSGSTGAPKGVMLSHRNATAFVDWAAAEFALGPADVLASHAPLHFDLSIFDIFGASAAGACVALVPEPLQGLGGGLIRFVAQEDVSVWYSVPGALRRMTEADSGGGLSRSRLRTVLFAGEVYHTSQLRALCTALPRQAAVYNLYGPTETNVCTYYRITAADVDAGAVSPVPIGRPCPYASTAILPNDARTPEAGEVVGEFCVSGESVMQGYWNDPAATQGRFVQLPGRSQTYYRTGDIVRQDAEGQLYFLGRLDHMTKVRGHRVELGEIEAALHQCPGVQDAVCVPVEVTVGETFLAAFVVPAPHAAVTVVDLKRHCRQMLPGYMIPQTFTLVALLARTSTGKVDRQAVVARASRQVQRQAGVR
jgi:amino acid adenylation domain-containing protein